MVGQAWGAGREALLGKRPWQVSALSSRARPCEKATTESERAPPRGEHGMLPEKAIGRRLLGDP